jgi:dienelactone hydrolase
VIGFSHGGWAVLKAVLSGLVRLRASLLTPRPSRITAVASSATRPATPLETDTLILIGDADDWTPAERCARWRNSVQTNGHVLQMKTYLGARHAFDALLPPHYFAGHYIGQDPAALADALIETRRFFDEQLMSKR